MSEYHIHVHTEAEPDEGNAYPIVEELAGVANRIEELATHCDGRIDRHRVGIGENSTRLDHHRATLVDVVERIAALESMTRPTTTITPLDTEDDHTATEIAALHRRIDELEQLVKAHAAEGDPVAHNQIRQLSDILNAAILDEKQPRWSKTEIEDIVRGVLEGLGVQVACQECTYIRTFGAPARGDHAPTCSHYTAPEAS